MTTLPHDHSVPTSDQQRPLGNLQHDAGTDRHLYGDVETLEPCFAEQCLPTLGVEVEHFIVDAANEQPLPLFDEICDRLPWRVRDRVHEEHLECQIEHVTSPCKSVQQVRDELREFGEEAGRAATALGAKLSWQAVLPDWNYDSAMVRDCHRSQLLKRRLERRVSNLAMSGLHVHVGVPRSQAIPVLDRLQTFVPLLVALSANSPVMPGRDELLASHRASIWSRDMAATSFPQQFGDWDGFNRHVHQLRRAGIIDSQKDLYVPVRPSRHGTIEIRCCDLPRNLDLVVALTALMQALVIRIQRDTSFEVPIETLHADLTNAIHNGRQARLTGLDGRRQPLSEILTQIIDKLRPIALEQGSLTHLTRLNRWVAAADATGQSLRSRPASTGRRGHRAWWNQSKTLAGLAAGWVLATGFGW